MKYNIVRSNGHWSTTVAQATTKVLAVKKLRTLIRKEMAALRPDRHYADGPFIYVMVYHFATITLTVEENTNDVTATKDFMVKDVVTVTPQARDFVATRRTAISSAW